MCNVSECNTEQNTQQQKQTKKNIPEQQSLRCVCVLWNGIARLAIATDVLYAFVHFGPFISRLCVVCSMSVCVASAETPRQRWENFAVGSTPSTKHGYTMRVS